MQLIEQQGEALHLPPKFVRSLKTLGAAGAIRIAEFIAPVTRQHYGSFEQRKPPE